MVGTDRVLGREMRRPEGWYGTKEARELADILVSWQNANGGWWKKYDPTRPRPAELPAPDEHDGPPGDTEGVWRPSSTFDNDATYMEMRILAKVYTAGGGEKYREAFMRGLGFVLEAQYPSGGWPQRFPLQDNYGRAITYNDGAMTNVMGLLRDIVDRRPDVAFVPEGERERCKAALAKGIDRTLALQVRVRGELTAWCQQYDPGTFVPAGARAYELPSLSACESAEIVMFLMELPDPDERVRAAVEGAVRWFRASAIEGKRVETKTGPEYEGGKDRVVVDDPGAPPIWARFYEIETNRPFFVGRDGVKRDSLAEVPYERRNGYGWYGSWGKKVEAAYVEWKKRVGAEASR
jgi:PelA/Pel-15E family pectate lyase